MSNRYSGINAWNTSDSNVNDVKLKCCTYTRYLFVKVVFEK